MASCRSHHLPPWPSLAELRATGYISEELSSFDVGLGIALGLGGGLPFLLQSIGFVRSRSVRGVSLAMLVFTMTTTILQFAVMVVHAGPSISVCHSLSLSTCFKITLDFQQLLIQAIGSAWLFLTYMFYLATENTHNASQIVGSPVLKAAITGSFRAPPPENMGTLDTRVAWAKRRATILAWVSFGITLTALGLIVAFVISFGPCAPVIYYVQLVVGSVATFVQVLVGLPQIILLCQLRDHGSLSVMSCIIQAVGGAFFAVDLKIEHASFLSLLPWTVISGEFTIIIVLIAVFSSRWSPRQRVLSHDGNTGINPGDGLL